MAYQNLITVVIAEKTSGMWYTLSPSINSMK